MADGLPLALINQIGQASQGPFGPDLKQIFTLQNLAQQTQLAQEEQRGRNTLRQLYGDPQFLDPKTNTLNQLGQQRLMQASPYVGMDYLKFLSQDTTRRAQEEGRRAVSSKARDAKMDTLAEDATNFYLDQIRAGKDPRSASDLTTQQIWGPGIDDLKTSGLCTGEECARLSSSFDYGRVSANRAVRKNQIEQERAALAERREQRQETRADVQTAQGAERIDIERGQLTSKTAEQAAEYQLESDLAKARKSGDQGEIAKAEQAIRDHNLARGRGGAASMTSSGLIEPGTLRSMAEQYLAGDRSVMQNLGRGAQGAENIAALRGEIAKQMGERGIGGAEMASRMAEFEGLKAGERSLGTRTAQMGVALSEAKVFAPLALAASEKVDRTQFPTLNSLLLAAERGTGGEEVIRLGVATNSLLNAYARAVSPTGVPTEGAQNRARELLSNAWSKGQYRTAIDQLMIEMDAAGRAPSMVREEFRQGMGAGTPGAAPAAAPAAAPSAASTKRIPILRGEAGDKQWADAPSGTTFVDENGREYKKP